MPVPLGHGNAGPVLCDQGESPGGWFSLLQLVHSALVFCCAYNVSAHTPDGIIYESVAEHGFCVRSSIHDLCPSTSSQHAGAALQPRQSARPATHPSSTDAAGASS